MPNDDPYLSIRPPSDEVVEHLASVILHLSSHGFAEQIDSRWSRRVGTLLTPSLRGFLRQFKCVAITVSNTHGAGHYTHMMNFAVMDVDNGDCPDRAKNVVLTLSRKLDEMGITHGTFHFINFTGKKGFRIWISIDKAVPENAVFEWLAEICRQCGYYQRSGEIFVEDPLMFMLEREWEPALMASHPTPELVERLQSLAINQAAEIAMVVDFDSACTDPHAPKQRIWTIKSGEKTYRLERGINDSLIQVYDDEATATSIDLLIASQEGKIVKVPFSQHQDKNRAGFFDLPVPRETISTLNFQRKPTQEDFDAAERIILGIRPISNEIFKDFSSRIPSSHMKRSDRTPIKTDFAVPEEIPREILKKITDKMQDTDCLKECLRRSLTEHGVYWNKASIVHVLAQCGIPTGVIAAYIRNHVNDDTDNSNPGILRQQVAYHVKKSAKWGKCHFMKNGKEPCCFKPCGRDHPSDNSRPHKIDFPGVSANPIDVTFRRILESRRDTLVYGATRSRKTSQAIITAMQMGRRMVLVVPRINIVKETVQRAMEIAAEQGINFKACYVSDNREICLRLRRLVELKVEENGGDDDIAMNDLKRWGKPTCTDCKAHVKVYGQDCGLIDNVLYGSADTAEGYCGYQTIIQGDWNLMVMSTVKFFEILKSSETGTLSPMNAMIQSKDLIVLDEASTLIESPYMTVPTEYTNADGQKYRLYDMIREQALSLMHYINSKLPAIMKHDTGKVNGKVELLSNIRPWSEDRIAEIEKAIQHFESQDGTVTVWRPLMTKDERDEARKFAVDVQKGAEGVALDLNIALNTLIDMCDLEQEAEWIIVNVPTLESQINLSIYIAPKAPDFSTLLGAFHGQVVCMDATPTIVPINFALDREFNVVNIGAPFERRLRHVIIPDLQPVPASSIESRREYMANVAWWAEKINGRDNMAYLATSKKLYDIIKEVATADIMWHRGTDVLGVPCEKRFGVALSLPNAPEHAMNWIRVPYGDALTHVTDKQLHQHEQCRQTVQAESRFKDPYNTEYSAVFSFGQTHSDCTANYLNSISPQFIFNSPSKIDAPALPTSTCPIPLLQAAIWMRFHVVVDCKADVWILDSITKGLPCQRPRDRERYAQLKTMVEEIVDLTPRRQEPRSEDVAALNDVLNDLDDLDDDSTSQS